MAVLVPLFYGSSVNTTGGGALTGELDSLDDVVINNPQNGQSLTYNGFVWTNQDLYFPSAALITGMQRDITGIDTKVQTVSSDLNDEIITRLNIDNFLQHQINEIASGYRLVFSEQFVGDGVSTSFQLSGAVSNAQIISGSWRTANVQNALPVNVTNLDGKVIYDAGILSLFTRHKISVTSLNGSSLGTLDYPPQLGTPFKIWYWYELSAGDRVDNYYRDDYVASMEETDGKLASAIAVDTTTFTSVLSSSDINAQLAFNRLDKHRHDEYITFAAVGNISSNLQSQITSICATNIIQTVYISEISGQNISQANQIASLSANAIILSQIADASANALSQTTNNLTFFISSLSGNDSSQSTQISELSGDGISFASQISALSIAISNSATLTQVSNASANALAQSSNAIDQTTNNLSALIFATSGINISQAAQIAALSATDTNNITLTQVSNASANALAQATSLVTINTALDSNQAIQIAALSGNELSQATQIAALSGNSISFASQITSLSAIPLADIFRIEIAAISAGLNTRIDNVTGSGSYDGPVPDIFRVEVAAVSSNLQDQIDNITVDVVTVNSAIIVMTGNQIIDRKDTKSFSYDISGHLVGLTGSVGTKTFQYNINGRITSISGTGLYKTSYFSYDNSGNLMGVIYI